MIDASTLLEFPPTVALITVSPEPDTIYAPTQSLRNGRSAGLVAGLGTATGVLIHTGAAVLGVAALLRASTEAYLLLKYAGAAYWCIWASRPFERTPSSSLETTRQIPADRSPDRTKAPC